MRPNINWITFGQVARKLKDCIKSSLYQKDVTSWLVKQVLWQVYIPPPKKLKYPHYVVTKLNEQHQFDLFYVPQNVFEKNTYMYILTGVDVI